jgi:hypothetical protein
MKEGHLGRLVPTSAESRVVTTKCIGIDRFATEIRDEMLKIDSGYLQYSPPVRRHMTPQLQSYGRATFICRAVNLSRECFKPHRTG